MRLAVAGAGSIRDSLLFESYMKQAIDFFKEPIDEIIVDGNATKGVRFLAEKFAEQHNITLLIVPNKNVVSMSDGLYVIWKGKNAGTSNIFGEAQRSMKMIYEVRLMPTEIRIGRHNEQQ